MLPHGRTELRFTDTVLFLSSALQPILQYHNLEALSLMKFLLRGAMCQLCFEDQALAAIFPLFLAPHFKYPQVRVWLLATVIFTIPVMLA